MKFYIALISLLLCISFIMAGREECPTFCIEVFDPVCGEAYYQGKLLRCQFGNSCKMGVSACVRRINWRPVSCKNVSPCADLV